MKKKVVGILIAILLIVSALFVACANKELVAPVITLEGDTVNWGGVDNATKYVVNVNGQPYETEETSYKLTVTEPGSYVITVSAVNGDQTKTSNEVTYKVTGTLTAPVITLSGNRISWNAVSGATSYEVYVNDTLKTTVSVTNYSMPLDLNEGSYIVTIKAKGGEFYTDSAKSNSVTFVVEPAAPLTEPLGKATIAINGRTVTWTAVAHATAYDVYVNGVKAATVTTTQFTFADRAEGKYSITVKATAPGSSAYTEGEASNAVEYTVAALDMSKPLVAYIIGTKTMVNFDNNARLKQDMSKTWNELSADQDYVTYAWRLEKQANTEFYKIKVSNGAYLTADTGANKAYYAAAENTDNQLWSFKAVKGGYFIRNKAVGEQLLCAGDVGTDVIHFYSLADNVSYQTWNLFNVEVTFGADIEMLAAPQITLTDNVVSWAAVTHATGYEVYVNGRLADTVTSLNYTIETSADGYFEVTVKAVANNCLPSLASNAVQYMYSSLDLTKPILATYKTNNVDYVAEISANGFVVIKPLSEVADEDMYKYIWYLEEDGDTGYFNIKLHNGNYLSWQDGKTSNGLETFEAVKVSGDAGQQWHLVPNGLNQYKLFNIAHSLRWASGRFVYYYSTDAAGVLKFTDNGAANWTFTQSDIEFVEKVALAAPQITLTGNVVSWTAVEHATGYEVYVNDVLATTVTNPTYTVEAEEDGYFNITVKAVGEGYLPSLISNQVQYMYSKLNLAKPILATYEISGQKYVAEIGADGYLCLKLLNDVADSDMYKYVWYLEKDGDSGLYKIKLYNGKYATWTGANSGQLEISANDVAEGASQQWNLALNGLNQYKLYNKAHADRWAGGQWVYYFSADGANNLKFTDNGPANWTFAQSDIEFVQKTALAVPQVALTDATVTWQAVENAVSYNVFVNGELKANVKANETLSYTIDAAEKGLYKVVIVAVANPDSAYLDSQGSQEVSYDNRSLFDNPVVAYYNDANQTLGKLNDDGTLGVGVKYDSITDYTDYLWTVEKITEGSGAGYYRIKLANGKYLSHYDNPNSGEVAQTIAAEDNVADSKQWWNLVEDSSRENAFKLQNIYFSNYYQNVFLGEWYGVYKYNGGCLSWTFFNWQAPVEG